MKRWLVRGGLLLLALIAAAALAGLWMVRSHLPDREAPRLAGLRAPVDVTFDARGIPTIRATSLVDAVRVQGYLVARGRS